MKRKLSPIVYSIVLWIIGLCLLLSEVALTITFVYMFLATPLIIFFAGKEGCIMKSETEIEEIKEILKEKEDGQNRRI